MNTRREFMKMVGVGAAATAVSRSVLSSRRDRPNVILIMADDMGVECVESYGGTAYRTPVMNRMAESGLKFDNCHSQPLCTPSRVKIMTGRYNLRNYIGFGTLDPAETTFGHLMQKAGYVTAVAGKWQLSGEFGRQGIRPEHAGFDEYCLWQVDRETKGSRYWNPNIIRNGKTVTGLENSYGPDVFCKFITDFIETHREYPFFVYYPMVLTHGPHTPTPDTDGDKSAKRDPKYFADMVAYCDKILGQILEKVGEFGLAENTIVMFTIDNGTDKKITTPFNDRDIKGGKGRTTDSGTHVPLFVDWKGVVNPGSVCANLVDFADFVPTMLDAADAPVPDNVDGRSFLPQIRGENGNPHDYLYCYYTKMKGPDTAFSDDTPPKVTEYVRNERYKLYKNGGFYDVLADPEEKSPISSEAGIRKRFQTALDLIERDRK